jgi:hypothetical protein
MCKSLARFLESAGRFAVVAGQDGDLAVPSHGSHSGQATVRNEATELHPNELGVRMNAQGGLHQ